MIHETIAAFFRPSGPYLYVRLVTAAYALSAIGRLIPVKRKQVPGYRPGVPAMAWARESARHRAQPGKGRRRLLWQLRLAHSSASRPGCGGARTRLRRRG
jgi:hypothetical protein